MGCAASKRKQNALYTRLSQYQIAAQEDTEGLKQTPVPLDVEEFLDGCITLRQFHNMFYDGFYAPFIRNPDYMLLIDVRDEVTFLRKHILTAKWHERANLDHKTVDLSRYSIIILYNQDGSGANESNSLIRKIYTQLRERKLEPYIVLGGIHAMEQAFPHLITSNEISLQNRPNAICWYPSIIMENKLFLGRADQATNPTVIYSLRVTHIVCVNESIPSSVFPTIKYLTVPLAEGKENSLLSNIPKIVGFISDALSHENGRVLVHGDQGICRSAAAVMAFLMQDKLCTLEDGYYFMKNLRPTVQINNGLLEQLSDHEKDIFGKKITDIDDLWY